MGSQLLLFVATFVSLLGCTYCLNFPYESIQLNETDVQGHPELAFGVHPTPFSELAPNITEAPCRTYPGDPGWPSPAQWSSFNLTLGGALIKPTPLAAPCYPETYNAELCTVAQRQFTNSSFHVNDPASVQTQWTEGGTCLIPTLNSTNTSSTCTGEGFPFYVVNATSVKQIQLAINFARNSNLRLVIKNTGHSFLGGSTGGGALSIWTHNLNGFEFLPDFSIGDYRGKAARLGAGIQTWQLQRQASDSNVTIVSPGGSTVGVLGGYMQGGGHGGLTSTYGLFADNVISLQVVTADGRFITADPENNQDLFFALRGGGGGTFGVVTSAIVKAYNLTGSSSTSVFFSTGPQPDNSTLTSNTFWKGIQTYLKHSVRVCDAGGLGFGFVTHGSTSTILVFTASISVPRFNTTQIQALVDPLVSELKSVGVNITNSKPSSSTGKTFSGRFYGFGDTIEAQRISSRLFPRENLEDEELLNSTVQAIRSTVEEGGYTFHPMSHSPTYEVAGYPDNAVNPAHRNAVLHAQVWDTIPGYGKIPDQLARWQRMNSYVQKWRDLSPGAGSYINEGDVAEPDWQQSFYGSNYDRLLQIKQSTDPWNLFWAPVGVGSDGWAVQGTGGVPTQNGRLCRVQGAQQEEQRV